MFERGQKIFVQFLLFSTGLVFKTLALFNRVVLFGVTGRNFLPVDATFKNFDAAWVVRRKFCQRHKFFGQVRHENWVEIIYGRFNQFFKHRAGDFKVLVFLAYFRVEIMRTLTAFGRRNVEPVCASFFAD